MCQPGDPLTCGELCVCGRGQIPLETEWEGGEVKGVACWYYVSVCVCGGVNGCVCDVAEGAEQQNSGRPVSRKVTSDREEEGKGGKCHRFFFSADVSHIKRSSDFSF